MSFVIKILIIAASPADSIWILAGSFTAARGPPLVYVTKEKEMRG